MLTIVGLGPADISHTSHEALEAINRAERLLFRTIIHPAARDLITQGISFESFDALYDNATDFKSLYYSIALKVADAASTVDVVYAVPGHPMVAEETVRLLLPIVKDRGIPYRIISSMSFLEPTLAALEVSINQGIQLHDALEIDSFQANPNTGLLIYQIYDKDIAAAVKLRLLNVYPDDWEVTVVTGAGAPSEYVKRSIPLHKLDRIEVNHLTTLFVPALPKELQRKRFEDLVWVMSRLRGPGGCPWDIEQDHLTLKRYMIEECYEAIEAIDNGDVDALCEELGDVLLQVVFHAQLETEVGVFTIEDVITSIVDKLIRRHPHVFGDLSVEDADEVLRNWEVIKRSEKAEGWRKSILDGIPHGLPALMLAMETSKRVVKIGFEWDQFEDVLNKLEEELNELREAIAIGDSNRISDELGDLLFTIVNIARWKKVDPEESLRQMVKRFGGRFRFVENQAEARGRSLTEMSLAEMDELWNEAKSKGL